MIKDQKPKDQKPNPALAGKDQRPIFFQSIMAEG
jgi:hypothetical protein